jgi:hypothetical protein
MMRTRHTHTHATCPHTSEYWFSAHIYIYVYTYTHTYCTYTHTYIYICLFMGTNHTHRPFSHILTHTIYEQTGRKIIFRCCQPSAFSWKNAPQAARQVHTRDVWWNYMCMSWKDMCVRRNYMYMMSCGGKNVQQATYSWCEVKLHVFEVKGHAYDLNNTCHVCVVNQSNCVYVNSVCIYIYIFVCICHKFVRACFVCMRAYVTGLVCMCVRAYMYSRSVNIHTWYLHKPKYWARFESIHTFLVVIYMYTQTHTYALIYAQMHTHRNGEGDLATQLALARAGIHTYIHTYTCI